ncbi:MAG TPA: hypothetical protein VG146_03010 [Verrucomicrobiae bacterium]|nr:hypothetical protein [Verrucomicrobiae bacterium]
MPTLDMSMAELMRVVAGLPAEQQNELAAFLLHLRLRQDPEWRAEMARRIDDKDPAHWQVWRIGRNNSRPLRGKDDRLPRFHRGGGCGRVTVM